MSSPHGSAAGLPPPPDASAAMARPNVPQPVRQRRRKRWPTVLAALVVAAAIAVVIAQRGADRDTDPLDELSVGDCFTAPDTPLFTPSQIDVVDCSAPHNHEVYAIGTADAPIGRTPDPEADPEIVRICRTEVAPRVLDVLAGTPGVTPGVIATQGDAGTIVCSASTPTRTGSLLAAATAS